MKKDEGQLLSLAKSGDSDALTQLIVDYNNLLRRAVAPYYIVGADRDDLLQEATLGLISAVKLFDATKGQSFSSFVFSIAKCRVIDAVRASTRKKNSPLNTASPITCIGGEDGEQLNVDLAVSTEDPMDAYVAKESREALSKEIAKLSTREQEILKVYFAGYSYQGIADRLNLPIKTVDNVLTRIRRKLRKKLEGETI